MASLGRRHSSRKRGSPDVFVPTPFRSSPRLHGHGLRHGPGRPPKHRSDVPSIVETQSPASQPLRRGPGRPRKQQSDAPAVSPPPASLSGSSGDTPLQISVTTSTPEAVSPTPLGPTSDQCTPEAVAPTPLGSTSDQCTPEAVAPSPLRSTSDRPLEVPSGEEGTKLGVKPSRILVHPPKRNHSPQILDEELKDVSEHIKYLCDLQDTEKEETMLSLSALQQKYENDILGVKDVEEDLGRTQRELKIAKDKKKTLKRQIKDLKTEVACIKHEEKCLKHDKIKYKEAHEVAKAKMQELGTQLEEAQAKQREIEQRKNAALRGIASTTRHLQSTLLDDLT